MGNHPIENIMQTTMENIRSMVDVNTIVGDTVVMGDGTIIIPISKVSFGFVAGGGEYGPGSESSGDDKKQSDQSESRGRDFPFAGGAGAGVSISPMAFLVVSSAGDVNLLPVQFNSSYERMLGRIPEFIMQVKDMFCSGKQNKGNAEPSGKETKETKESWFSRNKRSRFDEDEAVDENYRPAKDEL